MHCSGIEFIRVYVINFSLLGANEELIDCIGHVQRGYSFDALEDNWNEEEKEYFNSNLFLKDIRRMKLTFKLAVLVPIAHANPIAASGKQLPLIAHFSKRQIVDLIPCEGLQEIDRMVLRVVKADLK